MSDMNTTSRTVPDLRYEGWAAEDIAPNSTVLKVLLPEMLPHSTIGTVGAGITTGATKLQNRDGTQINSPYTTANHIVATWEGESNVTYPPMIRAGEPVEVFQKAGQDKFYWRATGKGADFRKTDRVHVSVGATDPDKPGVSKDDTNTYSAYLDSHNKKVGMKTSKANGEAVAFVMEADTDAGTFYISDDSGSPGNRIYLDTGAKSGVPTFQVNLSSGITLKFENENAFISIPKNLQINAGERIVFNSPLTVFNLTQKGYVIINAASAAINAAKDFVITSAIVGINSTSTKITGILAATSAKITNLIKAAVTGKYQPVTVQRPEETPPVAPSNSADTTMTGPPYVSG